MEVERPDFWSEKVEQGKTYLWIEMEEEQATGLRV